MPDLRAFALFFALLSAPVAASDFPQRFDHMFGTTEVSARPLRIVSLGYVAHDDLLALGVVPVGLRYWYGDHPNGVWPWAEAALGETRPVVLRGEVGMEQVAALQPDLILAISSGITAGEYAILSQIAPTIASEGQYGDFATPWDVMAMTTGRAVGKEEEAAASVQAIRDRLAALREEHPEWQGQSGIVAYYWSGQRGGFRSGDPRSAILTGLGFTVPPEIDATGAGGSFYADLSPEDLSPLDTDLLLWTLATPDAGPLRALALRRTLRAHREGREVVADPLLAGAMSHASLLSIPYALDRLVPEIGLAVDGDPATPVPSAVATGIAP